MIICRKVRFQHISYCDAPEAQRHMSDRWLGRQATSGSGGTVGCASEIELKCALNSEHWFKAFSHPKIRREKFPIVEVSDGDNSSFRVRTI